MAVGPPRRQESNWGGALSAKPVTTQSKAQWILRLPCRAISFIFHFRVANPGGRLRRVQNQLELARVDLNDDLWGDFVVNQNPLAFVFLEEVFGIGPGGERN